jgi:DNA-binding NarL/FixJ family response regulator
MRILHCDDHALIGSAINSYFTNEPGYHTVGETENGNDLIKKTVMIRAELILILKESLLMLKYNFSSIYKMN